MTKNESSDINHAMMERSLELASPHIAAAFRAIKAAYPEDVGGIFALVLSFHLAELIDTGDPARRHNVVGMINDFIEANKFGYRFEMIQ
jgi:hypothetical protein